LLVLAAVLLVVYVLYLSPGAPRVERGRRSACQRNLQFIYLALQTYAADARGAYPALPGTTNSAAPLSLLVPRWTTNTAAFVCPESGAAPLPRALPFADRRISYAYVMGLTRDAPASQWLVSDEQLGARPKLPGELAFSPDGRRPANNHQAQGGNVLFADGRVEMSPPRAAFALPVPQTAVLLNPRR
jgi:prepilin-type processing-associated H-X9-DG protein